MSLRRSSVLGVAVKGLSIVLGLLVIVLLARVLGPEALGIYSVAYATVTILAVPARLGLPNFVVRETAKAGVEENGALMRNIWLRASLLVIGSSTAVLSVAYAWIFFARLEPAYASSFEVGLLLVPAIAMTAVVGGALRGIGRVIVGLTPEFVIRHVVFSALLVGWLTIAGELSASEALALHLCGALTALGFGVLMLVRFAPKWPDNNVPTTVALRTMIVSTGMLGLIAGIQAINSNLDVVMLGALVDAETAGIYKIASTAALLAVAGLQAINMVFMPRFAEAHKRGDLPALQRLATQSVRLILITALPGALILIFFGNWILNIAFGNEYDASYVPMVILVVGQLANAFCGSVVAILNMTGHEYDTLKGVLAACVLNVLLNVILIPLYGAEGAAIATASTLLAWNLLLVRVVRRRLNIVTTPTKF